MTDNNLRTPQFTSEDLTPGVVAPPIKRRRRLSKENISEKPYTPNINGLTSIRQLSSRTPLLNVTNTYASVGEYVGTSTSSLTEQQPIRSQCKGNKRKQDTVGKKLFHDTPLSQPVSAVDYENIETSHIVGFSDSEVDSETTESDEELYDHNEELVISSVPPPLNLPTPEVYSWAEMKMKEIPKEYKSLGAPKFECNKCGAMMWKQECSKSKNSTKGQLNFNICCYKGRVQLPPSKPTPPYTTRKKVIPDSLFRRNYPNSVRNRLNADRIAVGNALVGNTLNL